MHVDNNFSIKEFLLSNGFEQTRDSDKRDNFKKTYFDPWVQKDKEILVTLYYDYGSNYYTTYSGHVMQIYTKEGSASAPNYVNIYNGLWPHIFDFALGLFRHVLPERRNFRTLKVVSPTTKKTLASLQELLVLYNTS